MDGRLVELKLRTVAGQKCISNTSKNQKKKRGMAFDRTAWVQKLAELQLARK